jgi:hypothetical protein
MVTVDTTVAKRRGSSLSYSLVVSRGYVRLVRRGHLGPSRPSYPTFVRRGDEWVEAEANPGAVDLVEEEGLPTSFDGDHR